MHRRIELHNKGVMPLEEFADTTYDLVADGDEVGHGDPYAAFEATRYAATTPLFTEVAFDLRRDAGRIRGRIDAVYATGGEGWEVVDFKSGRDREDGPNLVQLQAYALAVADSAFGSGSPPHLDVSFVYLGGSEPVIRSHAVDDSWLERAAVSVDGILGAISTQEWGASPSEACRRCDFLRFCDEGGRFVTDS